jgi:hypothetical protein
MISSSIDKVYKISLVIIEINYYAWYSNVRNKFVIKLFLKEGI